MTARKIATYDDILAAPENMIAEIIDGELLMSPRPASPHAVANSVPGYTLGPAFHRLKPGSSGPGGWWILFEPELHIENHIVVPDLAGWRREKMPVIPSVPFFTQPPDWVCEVISPSSVRTDRIRKMDLYAQAGVGHAWLVDPEPFDAIEIELGNLWMPPSASTQT